MRYTIRDDLRWMVRRGVYGDWWAVRLSDTADEDDLEFNTWEDAYQYAYRQAKLAVTEIP